MAATLLVPQTLDALNQDPIETELDHYHYADEFSTLAFRNRWKVQEQGTTANYYRNNLVYTQ